MYSLYKIIFHSTSHSIDSQVKIKGHRSKIYKKIGGGQFLFVPVQINKINIFFMVRVKIKGHRSNIFKKIEGRSIFVRTSPDKLT